MRKFFYLGLLLAGCFLIAGRLFAADPEPTAPEAHYVAPEGEAPPVAPPLKKGSPLDHLTNDPKVDALPVGYKEGHTTDPIYWTGHRFIDDQGGFGWGWVKKGTDRWGSAAKWVTLQETPGVAIAPFRHLKARDGDADWEFKFWGHFATYKAYDPHLDELLPVFVLEGYEVIGPATPLKLKVGPPDRTGHRPSGASSRPNRPIMTDPNID